MIRRLLLSLALAAVGLAPRPSAAQRAGGGRVPDSIAVVGAQRVGRQSVLLTAGLVPGRQVSYRDIAHAIQALYATGQFDDIRIEQDTTATVPLLVIRVRERPTLIKWAIRGVSRLSGRAP